MKIEQVNALSKPGSAMSSPYYKVNAVQKELNKIVFD